MQVQVARGLEAVTAVEWDRLAGADDPFIEHRFLRALEHSGSVGEGTGWLPAHVLVRDAAKEGGALRAAMPCYVKDDSYGEYIFDWGWADAAHRAGIPYYPKLVAAVPFTPATGRRLLVEGGASSGPLVDALVAGAAALAKEIEASSLHLLFLTQAEQAALAEHHGLLPRTTHQYHWRNEGWGDFEAFLASLRSRHRKQIRHERAQAAASGLRLETLRGPQLSDAQWAALYRFYRDTTGRKHAIPYLKPAFFEALRGELAERVVVTLASRGDAPVAAALAFHKGRHLYGRYWGCAEEHPGLHFELCYYRLIEHAIALGCTRFEAGAQGPHKIKRGLMPSPTFSAHWLRDPRLARAVAEYLPREAAGNAYEMEALAEEYGPYKAR